MQINQVVENEDGGATISGSLSGQELEVAVTLGLNMLYAQGLMGQLAPSLQVVPEDVREVNTYDLHDGPEQSQ